MKANEQNFSLISGKGAIKVPFFQRAYVWGKDEWEKLFNDLIDSYKHDYTHFLGSIILKGNNSSSSLLIDGQQRTTTFSILLRVIGEQLENLDKYDNLRRCLFGQDANYEQIPLIEHSRLDRDVFSFLILGEPISKEKQNSLLFKCYDFFTKQVSIYKEENGSEKLQEFLKKILEDKLFVLVDIDKDEDAQRIFDSINTSGLPLSNFDIVKNDLFSHFRNDDKNEKSQKIYDKYWVPVFEKDEETKEFWDEEVLVGREHKLRSDIFLHNFAIIERLSESVAKISENYKTLIKRKNEEELIQFIEKFTKYASVFAELPFFNENEEYSYSDTMKRFLQITHVLQLSTLTPVALFFELLKKEGKLSEQEYADSLLLIEKYIVRRSLLHLTTSGYNKTIANLIDMLSKSDNIPQSLEAFLTSLTTENYFPNSKDIQKLSLESFDTKLAKLILFWIELKKRQEDREYADGKESLKFSFQLEHLMPCSWEKYWKLPIINTTLELFDKELLDTGKISKSIYKMSEYEGIEELNKNGYDGEKIAQQCDFRNMKVNELGNYTILSGKLNNSLKNYEWQRKLNGEGNKKGIKYYSSLSLNRELCDKYGNEWTEETITERTQNLKHYITLIW